MILENGWTILFHGAISHQLRKLQDAADRAQAKDPDGYERNANVKLLRALSQLILKTIPENPSREEYRQGKTLGDDHQHWRRAKIGRRFRLFFRYDSKTKVIAYAWVNDSETLRSSGSKSDPYTVFRKMLAGGDPPDEWNTLIDHCTPDWREP